MITASTLLLANISNAASDDEHFWRCWRIQDCGSCLNSRNNCGWCPYSSTCVPLPASHYLPSLLSPIRHPHICPLPWQERYELRTAPFGCNCSTTTLLTAIITVLCTLVGMLLLWGGVVVVVAVARWIKAASGGWEVRVVDGEAVGREGRTWRRRRGRGWLRLWRRRSGEDVEIGKEEEGWLGRMWRKGTRDVRDGERRPLLGR